MARQMAYDQLRAEVARWEFPHLEFHVPPPAGPAKEFGQMMLVVEAWRGANVVERYGITVPTVLKAKSLSDVVKDILTRMVLSWAKSGLKRPKATPPVPKNEGEKEEELTYPIMICSVCKKLDSLCECAGEPLRWRILQPEYHQSILRSCGRG